MRPIMHRLRDITTQSLARWGALLALGCLAVLAIALPLPDIAPERAWGVDEESAAHAERLARLSDARQAALADWRAARGLARWRESGAASDTAPIRFDASVPDSLVATLDTLVRREWTALGPMASGARAQVFVYADTVDPVPDSARRTATRTVTRSVVLPQSSGARCVVLVRLPSRTGVHPGPLTSRGRLLGPCGYMAVFGEPGGAMRGWLARTHWLAASSSTAQDPADALLDPDLFLSLPAVAAECATEGGSACRRALGLEGNATSGTPARWEDGVLHSPGLHRAGGARPPLLGAERRFLADVRDAVGPERFGAIWREEADLPAALTRALGEPVDAWAGRWLREGSQASREPVAPGPTDVLWVVGAAVLAVAAALPRERTRPRGD
jgi:hypothetical protein